MFVKTMIHFLGYLIKHLFYLFEIEIFCNIIHIFTVAFEQFNTTLSNKCINKNKKIKRNQILLTINFWTVIREYFILNIHSYSSCFQSHHRKSNYILYILIPWLKRISEDVPDVSYLLLSPGCSRGSQFWGCPPAAGQWCLSPASPEQSEDRWPDLSAFPPTYKAWKEKKNNNESKILGFNHLVLFVPDEFKGNLSPHLF